VFVRVCVCVCVCVCSSRLSSQLTFERFEYLLGFSSEGTEVVSVWSPVVCDVTHSYVRHDSFICKTWLVHMWDMTRSYVLSGVPEVVSVCICDVTNSCVRHDSFIRETWLIHMWDTTRSYVRHDSFICETWRTHMRDTTLSYVSSGVPQVVSV